MFHKTEIYVAKCICLHYEILPCISAGLCPLVCYCILPAIVNEEHIGDAE